MSEKASRHKGPLDFIPRKEHGTRFLMLLFLLALYYLSYRYPFKINSSTTSPTYSDTPAILQWMKYLIFAGLCGIFWLRRFSLSQRANSLEVTLIAGWALMFVHTLLLIILSPKSYFLMEIPIFFGVLIVCAFSNMGSVDYRKLYRIFHWFIILSYAANVMQFALYKLFDRLPALAYAGALTVRFGGIWDDPNAFALMHAFIIPFIAFAPYRRLVKYSLLGMAAFSLFLSQSISGFMAVIAGLGVVMLLNHWWRPLFIVRVVLSTIMIGTGIVGIYGFMKARTLYEQWMNEKIGSIEARGNFIRGMFELEPTTYLGLKPLYSMSENAYVLLLANYGVLAVLLFLATLFYMGWMFNRLRTRFHEPELQALINGGLGLTAGYALANIGVPSILVFPINMLIPLLFCLIILLNREYAARRRYFARRSQEARMASQAQENKEYALPDGAYLEGSA